MFTLSFLLVFIIDIILLLYIKDNIIDISLYIFIKNNFYFN